MAGACIGVDLGGTKIEAILLRDGAEMDRRRVPTPRHDYDKTLSAIVELVTQLEEQVTRRATVGVGIPGSIEPSTGLVKNANSVWLIGRALQHDLRARLERDVVVANDANCLALSEATDGAGREADVVVGVILGTGVGAGLSIGRQVRSGANGVSGEWGHNPLPWMQPDEYPGPRCYCGKDGCIEAFLSGPGLSADYLRRTGNVVAPEEIVRRAGADEPDAEATLQRYEHRAARAFASMINLLDPEVIVLGGGLSQMTRLYTQIPRLWAEFVFNCDSATETAAGGTRDRLSVRTALRPARHGDSSGVRGAAWLGERRAGTIE